MSIIEALDDPALFNGQFSAPSWRPWRTYLKALFGLRMDKDDRVLYEQCTGRSVPPTEPATESWLACGRRSGKSITIATVATFLAAFRSYQQYLAPGETPVVLCLAADKRQARIIFEYIRGILQSSELLRSMIEHMTSEVISLSNAVQIEVRTNSYKSVRGFSACAILADEIGHWRSDTSISPDFEVLNACRPALSTIPGSMLLCLSSPWKRAGALYGAYKAHYGKDGDPVLIWKAPSLRMNPTLNEDMIARAVEADPQAAQAEWYSEFRSDLQSFLDPAVVENAVDPGVFERPWRPNTHYTSFTDPSGGRHDSMCTAVAHEENGIAILDAVREIKSPFSPDTAVSELSDFLKSYGLTHTVGDHYSAEWVREAFSKCGVAYKPASESKSSIYLAALPLFNSSRVRLLDSQRLVTQALSLERRVSRGSSRDVIDHPPYASDDVINAVCGAVVGARARVPLDVDGIEWAEPRALEPLATLTELGRETEFVSLLDF